jgi:hypothetical protein
VCNGRTKAKREVLHLKIGDTLFLTCVRFLFFAVFDYLPADSFTFLGLGGKKKNISKYMKLANPGMFH